VPSASVERVSGAMAGHGAPAEAAADPGGALRLALAGLPEGGMLCVCGSLYLVGEIRRYLLG